MLRRDFRAAEVAGELNVQDDELRRERRTLRVRLWWSGDRHGSAGD
jgi:hypothetical protein